MNERNQAVKMTDAILDFFLPMTGSYNDDLARRVAKSVGPQSLAQTVTGKENAELQRKGIQLARIGEEMVLVLPTLLGVFVFTPFLIIPVCHIVGGNGYRVVQHLCHRN